MLKIKSLAVIDASVLVAHLLSYGIFTAELFGLIESGNIIPLFDRRMLDGYYDVLRSEINKSRVTEQAAAEALRKPVCGGFLVEDIRRTANEISEKNELNLFEIKAFPEDNDEPLENDVVSPKVAIAVLRHFDKLLDQMNAQGYREHTTALIGNFLSSHNAVPGKELESELFGDESKRIKGRYF